MTTVVEQRRTPARVEWPTVAAVAGWYLAMGTLLTVHRQLPTALVVVGLVLLGAAMMSLQHEVIHGHPTPWHSLNVAMVAAPWSLWCPYAEYRDSHLAHHASPLTLPGLDPESFHVSHQRWSSAGRVRRAIWAGNRTLLGRVTIGPLLTFGAVPAVARQAMRSHSDRRTWITHVVGVAVVMIGVVGVAGVPWWQYLLGFAYGGLALTLVRSFAEHRFTGDDATASAMARSNRFWSLLFLNNNLHHTHHAAPGVAWYQLPTLALALDSDRVANAGAGCYRGYSEIARRYGLRPLGTALHPIESVADCVAK